MTDYVWRGVTQSAHKASVTAFFEPRYNINSNWQLYAGVSGESIKFANNAAAEIDFYGGVRPTFGPLALDFGIWEYYYPGGICYGSGPLNASPNGFNVGSAGMSMPPAERQRRQGRCQLLRNLRQGDLHAGRLGLRSDLLLFAELPEHRRRWRISVGHRQVHRARFDGVVQRTVGWYVSGEFGHQWFGTSDAFYGVAGAPAPASYANGIPEPDYNTWNVGVGFTWKVFTLDLRYTDTDLSKEECSAFTSDPGATLGGTAIAINPVGVKSNWCGATFIAKLSTVSDARQLEVRSSSDPDGRRLPTQPPPFFMRPAPGWPSRSAERPPSRVKPSRRR